MKQLQRKDGRLFIEEVSLEELARQYGRPLYVYSLSALTEAYQAYEQALAGLPHLICYAVKANGSLAILQHFARLGAGFDIVSGGELFRARRAGIPAQRIVYSGVAKTRAEIDYALREDILMFNIESAQELEVINQRAASLGCKARIALRVNPDVDPKTHPYISTGLKKNKFGISDCPCTHTPRRLMGCALLSARQPSKPSQSAAMTTALTNSRRIAIALLMLPSLNARHLPANALILRVGWQLLGQTGN